MKYLSHNFRRIYTWDFEFHRNQNDGNQPTPICVCARELLSGQKYAIWLEEGSVEIPFSTGKDSLFIGYSVSAEIPCHCALNWPIPEKIIDLYAEFRTIHNGRYFTNDPKKRWNMLAALTFYNLSNIGAERKNSMRDRILQGPPYSKTEREQILEYCYEDVIGTERLFQEMLPHIEIPSALMRGEFSSNCGRIEFRGIPIDYEFFKNLHQHWDNIERDLIETVDKDYQVFEGTTFKQRKFLKYVLKNGIPWPRTPTGMLKTDSDTFREMAIIFPQLQSLKELMATRNNMRLWKLSVGTDRRNRCSFKPFWTITGRCAPSNANYIFGPARCIRSLIKPDEDKAVCLLDFSQQEYGIASVLSGDSQMQASYKSGDPYISFARIAKAVPPEATKKSHPEVRDLYKQCVLAIGYGMGFRAFALRIKKPESFARKLMQQHKEAYPDFWRWSDSIVRYAHTRGTLETCFGWRYQWPFNTRPFEEPNPRQLRNWLMQSTGSEMLRLAVHMLLKNNIGVVGLVHDAVLIEMDLEKVDEVVDTSKQLMIEASKIILGGFEIGVDAKIVKFPDRYVDSRGAEMWGVLSGILEQNLRDSCESLIENLPDSQAR